MSPRRLQGMHELLALLVLALVRDQTEPSSGDSVLHVVTSSAFIEHDSYCLFDKLMETMRDWFESKPQVYRKPPTSISSLVDVRFVPNCQLGDPLSASVLFFPSDG